MESKNALRSVISTLVLAGMGLGVAADAAAATTLAPYYVTGYSWAPSYQPGDGSYGGGGGFGGAASTFAAPDDPWNPVCDSIYSEGKRQGCDVWNPPKLTVNGCGPSAAGALFPDYVVGWANVGDVLTSACNKHDACYGTYGLDKHGCDNALKTDMINSCILVVGPNPAGYAEADFLQKCKDQAELYSSVLQGGGLVESITSGLVFTSEQDDAFCRYMSTDFANHQCDWIP